MLINLIHFDNKVTDVPFDSKCINSQHAFFDSYNVEPGGTQCNAEVVTQLLPINTFEFWSDDGNLDARYADLHVVKRMDRMRPHTTWNYEIKYAMLPESQRLLDFMMSEERCKNSEKLRQYKVEAISLENYASQLNEKYNVLNKEHNILLERVKLLERPWYKKLWDLIGSSYHG